MKVTRRDMIVLACFTAVVVIGTVGMVWIRSRPMGETSLLARAGQAQQAQGEELASEILDESRIYSITQSGLFTPLAVEQAAGGANAGQARGVSVETKQVYEVVPKPSTGPSKHPGPPGPVGPGADGPGPMGPGSFAKPTAIDVAITGVVIGGKTVRALVESNTQGRAEWVDVPGEAFGYRVKYVTLKGAVLEKGDRSYVLLLGANLKRKDVDYKVAGAEGAPPPGGGGPSPEEMAKMGAKMAEYSGPSVKYGGGRGGRGGGRARMSMEGAPSGAVVMKSTG